MTIGDLLKLMDNLNAFIKLKPNLDCFKLYYAIHKNLDKITNERNILLKTFPLHEKSNELNKKRNDIKLKYCDKDDKGNPIIENNILQITDKNKIKLNADIIKLDEEYQDVIIHNQGMGTKLEKQLQEESDIDIYKINISDMIDSNGHPLNLDYETTALIYHIIRD